jgi:uncharacterized protein (TIGR02452 family)
MKNLRQTTLPFVRASASKSKSAMDVDDDSQPSTSKVSTSSSSYSSRSAPTKDQRDHLRQLAKDTLSIVEKGWYITPSGRSISIGRTVEDSLKGTLFYPPDAWDKWETNKPAGESFATQFRLREVTTLEASKEFAYELRRRAIDSGSSTCPTVGVLNFASAKKPGGGFLNGAKAQEESIARVSSLYLSLTTPTGLQFYKSDVREKEGPVYSHAMVYSPSVVVFNTDEGITLEEPYEISMLTCPAVNAGVVRSQNRHQDEGKVERAITRLVRTLFLYFLFETYLG